MTDETTGTQDPKDDAQGVTATDAAAQAGATGGNAKHTFVLPPHPKTVFDEEKFLTLLEGSLSLSIEEKQRVVDAIADLELDQINELMNIFEEEKKKFAELGDDQQKRVEELKAQREKELERMQDQQEEESEADADAAAAAALKAQMGL